MKKIMARDIKAYLTISSLFILLAGCGTSRKASSGDESGLNDHGGKIISEAYLFDAKIKREGKVNSFRLEIFQTDSALGLGGRGYLGKGVLKGRVTPDSFLVYLPTANEYIEEAVDEFLSTLDCAGGVADFNILNLFTDLPDPEGFGEGINIYPNYNDGEEPIFEITANGCPWLMELTYDRRESGWRIRDLSFTDGEDLTFEARRREYRARTGVKEVKFRVKIPGSAIKIKP
ncbi:MAG: hypothetical protein ACOYVF_02530 [Candidatus Zixiibacteriota bacterium]